MLEVPEGPLRHGYTTGACATACAKGALLALLQQRSQTTATIWIPAGQWVT
ncbi:MAG: cobalt-precorrin-5B (C(1))-methyltransferase, partial [Alicyclobacillus sp.]|nr:cobalt-precorrin-5B (C(1))-methyltransferase [Alicyclobacillus sp.]